MMLRSAFLTIFKLRFVADSKLCTTENMEYIASREGKFITVLPKTRGESKAFLNWVEDHPVRGQALWYRNPFPRKEHPKDSYRGFESSRFNSKEGYRIVWILSSQKQKLDAQKRRQKIQEVEFQLHELCSKLNTYSLKTKKAIRARVEMILEKYKMQDLFTYEIKSSRKYFKKQLSRGRPGPKTSYRVITKTYYHLRWSLNKEVVMKKAGIKSLLIYPEQRECRKPSAEQILGVFQNISKHDLWENDELEETFFDPLNDLQLQILQLLKILLKFYCKN